MEEIILKVQKGESSCIINCEDKEHYKKLLYRFKKKGYKQVPYLEEKKIETYCF